MKALERYVFGAFLSSFFLAFLVLSFVLTIGLMVKIAGYVLQGVPMDLVGRFALVSFPETMQWTIPIGLLVASILVFSRLSADSEVAAMRACGVNLITVMRWPLLFAFACSLLGLYINNEIVPRGHEVRRHLTRRISVGAGLELLEPGTVIDDFPKVKVYFEERDGNWLKDLVVLNHSNPRFDQIVRAEKAFVRSEGRDVVFDLYNVMIKPIDEEHDGEAHAARFSHRIKDALKDGNYRRKEKDFRFFEMLRVIAEARMAVKNPEDYVRRQRAERVRQEAREARNPDVDAAVKAAAAAPLEQEEVKLARKSLRRGVSDLKTEFMKRWVFAFASICFVLVGVPLGIKAQRRESTIGMAIALVTALCYYLVVILMTSMSKNYAIHPEVLIWLPVAFCLAFASWLIPKNL